LPTVKMSTPTLPTVKMSILPGSATAPTAGVMCPPKLSGASIVILCRLV
jgi:hypothetical protein